MTRYLLFALFFVLFASEALGIDTSLAPGLSVKNAFLYLIFLVLAIETAVTRRRKLEILSVFVPFATYVLYAIFSWLIVLLLIDYPGYDLRTTLIALKGGPVENLMVLLVFFYGVSDKQRALWLFRGIVWLVILGNVVTIVDTLNIWNLGVVHVDDDGRIGGTIGNANEFGAFLAFFLPAIIALWLNTNGWRKLLAGVGTFLSCLAFLMAVSRGAIAGLVASGVLGTFFLRRSIPPQTLVRAMVSVLLLCVVVGVAALAAGYGNLLMERFSAFGHSSFEATSGRTVIWGRALNEMIDYPVTFVTGFGWDAYAAFRSHRFATHNSYLNILYNLGTVGVALYLLTVRNVLAVARSSLSRAESEVRPLIIGFIFGYLALLVAIFFGELHTTWLYVWAFVGVSLRLSVSVGEEEPVVIRPVRAG